MNEDVLQACIGDMKECCRANSASRVLNGISVNVVLLQSNLADLILFDVLCSCQCSTPTN